MTNAQKYEEVFGMKPETSSCPTNDCKVCPCGIIDNKGGLACFASRTEEWWKSEYKEGGIV